MVNPTQSNNMSVAAQVDENCAFETPEFAVERFWLVSVSGTIISLISIAENSLLFLLFFTKSQYRRTHTMYLMLLAVFDIFMSIAYIMLMSTNALMDHIESVLLLRAWHFYMKPMFTVSHVAMTASSFLIVAAAFERYCITLNNCALSFVQNNRKLIAFGAIVFSALSKCTVPLEYKISTNPDCANTMLAFILDFSELAYGHIFHTYWKVWYRHIVTIILPFFLLAYFNVHIVIVLRRTDHTMNIANQANDRRSSVRAATRMLLLVVCTYLIANALSVVVSLWEFIDFDSLQYGAATFYTFSVDIVSLLTIVASAARLPIYCACNKNLRKDFCQMICCWSLNKNEANETLFTTMTRTNRQNGSVRQTMHDERFDVQSDKENELEPMLDANITS